jgi:hypothetical protein
LSDIFEIFVFCNYRITMEKRKMSTLTRITKLFVSCLLVTSLFANWSNFQASDNRLSPTVSVGEIFGDHHLNTLSGRDVTDGCDLPIDNILLNSDGTVVYNSSSDIGGFQFNVDGATVDSATGGDAGAAGMMISTSGDMVLGFSMTGSTFGPCGTMINLVLSGDAVGFSAFTFSDAVGGAIDLAYYDEDDGGDGGGDLGYPDCLSSCIGIEDVFNCDFENDASNCFIGYCDWVDANYNDEGSSCWDGCDDQYNPEFDGSLADCGLDGDDGGDDCSDCHDDCYDYGDTQECHDDCDQNECNDGPPECLMDCPNIQPLVDFLDNGIDNMTYEEACGIFLSWDGDACIDDCPAEEIEFLTEVGPACTACIAFDDCEFIFVDECDQCHDTCSDEDQECHDLCDQSEACEDDEGCEPCDGADGCGSYYSEGECLEQGCDWLGWEEGPGCDDGDDGSADYEVDVGVNNSNTFSPSDL